MAFQSAVLIDGEWVMQQVNVQDALRAYVDPKPPLAFDEASEAPEYGIITRTIIDSPYARWIIPARLRSEHHNDIAFIGDRYIQINQLREDGQLHEVIYKIDFDYRIRNAVVIGEPPQDDANIIAHSFIKTEDDDVPMQDDASDSGKGRIQPLPPQILVLILETGDIVFLFVRERADGSLEFVTNKYDNHRKLEFLGFHLVVDPSSRYMAAACGEDVFIVYELEPMATLNANYIRDGSFNPIKSIRPRLTQGIIQNLAFLSQSLEEENSRVSLLLLLMEKDPDNSEHSLRYAVYDWAVGDDLQTVFAQEQPGLDVPEPTHLPLLIVPLKFNGAFIAISAQSITIGVGAVEAQLRFEAIPVTGPDPARETQALWTAWARPYRRKDYFEKTDVIYLAREDGVINYVEIDESTYLPTVHNAGTIDMGVTDPTAFTTAYDRVADVLINGGPSTPGGIWKLHPRSSIQKVGTIPSWSPVWDLTVVGNYSSWTTERPTAHSRKPVSQWLSKPDRLFSASGQGPGSALTELRFGLEARIGLEFDYSNMVRQSWMFPVDAEGERSHYALLSLPHVSEVFHISGDLDKAEALAPESSPFDMSCRTICAVQHDNGTIVQITETSTNLVVPTQSSRHPHSEVLGQDGIVAGNAFCMDDCVVLSAHNGYSTAIHVLRIDQMHVAKVSSWNVQGEVTCLSMFKNGQTSCMVIGVDLNTSPYILIFDVDGRLLFAKQLNTLEDEPYGRLEALTSISVIPAGVHGLILVLGTRSGHIVTGRISPSDPNIKFAIERVATGPAHVFSVSGMFGGEPVAFACYDNTLCILSDFWPYRNLFKLKNRVWLTDLQDPSLQPPPIRSVFCLEQSLYGYQGHVSLLMLAGSQVLLADIRPRFGLVPRSIRLEGTPSRVLYSRTWKCLIVSHLKNHMPTLSFIDPDSGATLSRPFNKVDNVYVEYVSGLGVPNITVRALGEWHYVKDGKTFPFIIIGTDHEFLVVSVQEVPERERGPMMQLRYWTRYRRKGYRGCITAVVGCPQGVLIAAGRVLHWEILDAVEKKLKPVKQFQLESEAISVEVVDGKAFVSTAKHSLQVIDMHTGSETAAMELIHGDELSRRGCHQIGVGEPDEPTKQWPIQLISTLQGGIAGLWIPWNRRRTQVEMVFEGHLPTAIRKFLKVRTRSTRFGFSRRPRFDSRPSTTDGAEILGVSLLGAVYHFSLIGHDLWRFLCLIQTLAHLSVEVCPLKRGARLLSSGPLDMEVELEPRMSKSNLHLDGDVLQRVLDRRALKALLRVPDAMDLFREYLDGIDDGIYTDQFRRAEGAEGDSKYMEVGYGILEYMLAPVL